MPAVDLYTIHNGINPLYRKVTSHIVVMFNDESRFYLSNVDSRFRVWLRKSARFKDRCVIEANRWGGGLS